MSIRMSIERSETLRPPMIDIGAIDCRLLGKEGSRPVPLFFPVAGRARGALHWGQGGASRRALREQCGLTPHFAGRGAPAKCSARFWGHG